ncbi:hypothetical protein LWI29_008476 [Acer saccharum]|uniref:Uncharacterized protein n=1 Tax=Acer saccharum TaxID=4024 RepID=A0AA39RGS2_ACESA|nr:hypothetical protein LWI29_008476 [Acer saccharum]KAK1552487.1 hypothetical protein Q3G72_018063 [Acer saccharum]
MRPESRGSGEHRGCAVLVDLPDEVGGRVRDEGEEDALAGAEVVGGEGVEGRRRWSGLDDGEDAFVGPVDGEAEDGNVYGQVGIGD